MLFPHHTLKSMVLTEAALQVNLFYCRLGNRCVFVEEKLQHHDVFYSPGSNTQHHFAIGNRLLGTNKTNTKSGRLPVNNLRYIRIFGQKVSAINIETEISHMAGSYKDESWDI